MRLKLQVMGIVQGVGFRPFIYHIAVANKLKGSVRNKGDAGVEILLEGEAPSIQRFMQDFRRKKPPLAQIHQVIQTRLGGKEEFASFSILESSSEAEFAGSVIPPDVALCNYCLDELRDPHDVRHNYFFITCTNCGPRFTIIKRLPYDRRNTTMQQFNLCDFCKEEYKNSQNRRFHAQTVACPKCGPRAFLATNDGKVASCKDPIRKAGELISDGHILAVKGYGGFHVATSATKEEPLTRLRKVKHRSQKPFAVMARSLDATQTFALVSESEEQLLSSHTRPIILLRKSSQYCLSELVAPGLHNIGVMLPYTGLHYMLFDRIKDAAFVMTSANPPNQPIIKDDEDAFRMLGDTVDYFLLHDRYIAHRCDDSVTRFHGNKRLFLRRSRGYAPAPILLRERAKHCSVGLGGELNNTSCVLSKNKAFISQHIGNVENIETRSFLKDATKHLIDLTNSKIEMVVCDLHPKFTTTSLALELARRNDWGLVQVQHHHAHVATLLAEHNIDEIIGICCDGYGYGSDGEAWGGEILLCTRGRTGFKRLAHLERQPLPGGDLATRYTLRLAAAILSKRMAVDSWLLQESKNLPYGKKEYQIILRQLEKGLGVIETTSTGRILDAVAAVLGICFERTYEGEPALKLESAALRGRDVLKLDPVSKGNTLQTTELLWEVFQKKPEHSISDLAYSAHAYLAKGLARMAIDKAEEQGVKAIGFTGGVACNEILAEIIRKEVESRNLRFHTNELTPSGDGSLSFGQAVLAAFQKS